MKLEDVIQRSTRALQPAATIVPIGTLYFVTDESIIERSNGTIWQSYSGAAGGAYTSENAQDDVGGIVDTTLVYTDATPLLSVAAFVRKRVIGIVIDGGGVAITTGIKGYLRIPFTGTITKVTLLADQSGSIVIDVWKDTYANYPPTVADTITAAAKPTITAALKSEDSTLTGWTVSITSGDVLGFKVDSITTITRVTLELEVTVTG